MTSTQEKEYNAACNRDLAAQIRARFGQDIKCYKNVPRRDLRHSRDGLDLFPGFVDDGHSWIGHDKDRGYYGYERAGGPALRAYASDEQPFEVEEPPPDLRLHAGDVFVIRERANSGGDGRTEHVYYAVRVLPGMLLDDWPDGMFGG